MVYCLVFISKVKGDFTAEECVMVCPTLTPVFPHICLIFSSSEIRKIWGLQGGNGRVPGYEETHAAHEQQCHLHWTAVSQVQRALCSDSLVSSRGAGAPWAFLWWGMWAWGRVIKTAGSSHRRTPTESVYCEAQTHENMNRASVMGMPLLMLAFDGEWTPTKNSAWSGRSCYLNCRTP